MLPEVFIGARCAVKGLLMWSMRLLHVEETRGADADGGWKMDVSDLYHRASGIVGAMAKRRQIPIGLEDDCIQEAVIALWQGEIAKYRVIDFLRRQSGMGRAGWKAGCRVYPLDPSNMEYLEAHEPPLEITQEATEIISLLSRITDQRYIDCALSPELSSGADVARKYNISHARVCQLRAEVQEWVSST